jgi:phage gpG-like protein
MARLLVEFSPLLAELDGLSDRVRDWRRPLKAWGVYMVGSIKRNFDSQGRPVKWRALKVKTLIARYMRTAGARKLRERDKGKGRFAPSAAIYKSKGGVGALSTIPGFARSGRTGRILRRGHGGTNKFAQAGLAFRRAVVAAVTQGKILLDRGRLRSSVTSAGEAVQVDRTNVSIGTNLVYAASHQFGDPGRGIPTRPYLVIQGEDERSYGQFLVNWLMRGEVTDA